MFNISVLEYLGKINNGILVLLSIVYKNKYYESTFYYTNENIVLTISEDLEKEINSKIELHPEYQEILRDILKKIVPYGEMYNRLDNVDFTKWIKGEIKY